MCDKCTARAAKPKQEEQFEIPLNIFDKDGVQVDTTSCLLSLDQISDIIDHAVQLVEISRGEDFYLASSDDFFACLDSLEEAITSAGVLPDEDEG